MVDAVTDTMSPMLNQSWDQWLLGMILGKAGEWSYRSWVSSKVVFDGPSAWLQDVQTRPIRALFPYIGGVIGNVYIGSQMSSAWMSYLVSMGCGAAGYILAQNV